MYGIHQWYTKYERQIIKCKQKAPIYFTLVDSMAMAFYKLWYKI